MESMEKERIASLEAKMDYIINQINNLNKSLSSNYVPRPEVELRFKDQGDRLTKLESAPYRQLSMILSIVSIAVAIWAVVSK